MIVKVSSVVSAILFTTVCNAAIYMGTKVVHTYPIRNQYIKFPQTIMYRRNHFKNLNQQLDRRYHHLHQDPDIQHAPMEKITGVDYVEKNNNLKYEILNPAQFSSPNLRPQHYFDYVPSKKATENRQFISPETKNPFPESVMHESIPSSTLTNGLLTLKAVTTNYTNNNIFHHSFFVDRINRKNHLKTKKIPALRADTVFGQPLTQKMLDNRSPITQLQALNLFDTDDKFDTLSLLSPLMRR